MRPHGLGRRALGVSWRLMALGTMFLVWPGPISNGLFAPRAGARSARPESIGVTNHIPLRAPTKERAAVKVGARAVGSSTPVRGAVLEIGDSLGIDLGWGLAPFFSGGPHRFVGAAVGDTGLVEPAYYSWPLHLASELVAWKPGLVIVFLGANDVQSFYQGGRYEAFGSPSWLGEYGRRVALIIDEAVRAHARVLWVGMPPMGSSLFSADMTVLNRVYRAQTAKVPGAAFLSTTTVLGGPAGTYLPGPPGGAGAGWRAPDGVHITVAGAHHLAAVVVGYLRAKKWL